MHDSQTESLGRFPADAEQVSGRIDTVTRSDRTQTAAPVEGADWIVIVPVKPTALGKTRLADVSADHEELARAIALDTIAAASAAETVDRVIVVTGDDHIANAVKRMPKVEAIRESDIRGLDAAITTGASAAGTRRPRAALLGDLPALQPSELDAALYAASGIERGVVADAEGTGSTLVTARAGATWISAFGEDSFARHRLLGCTPLAVPAESSLRRDVDTAAQLSQARSLGLGPRTSAVLEAAAA